MPLQPFLLAAIFSSDLASLLCTPTTLTYPRAGTPGLTEAWKKILGNGAVGDDAAITLIHNDIDIKAECGSLRA